MVRSVLLAALFVISLSGHSADQKMQWKHKGAPAQVIELFTSEGCSSCPPADSFLSRFKSKDKLWEQYIPIAFHVDYWNYLGWKDEFSDPSFSARQRNYRQQGLASSVYTPGFFVDGAEWQGYFYRRDLPRPSGRDGGTLTMTRNGGEFLIEYSEKGRFNANLVLLAMDETTRIKAGENRGKLLSHDFIVLSHREKISENSWRFSASDVPRNADAIAVWLTKEGQFQPVQTVAGYLNH